MKIPSTSTSLIRHASLPRGLRSAQRRLISTQELDDKKGDRTRVVILGSGWAGFTLLKGLNLRKYQPVVISPRPYFVFTPLLASTSVGTLEFRLALESARNKESELFEGSVNAIDWDKKRVRVVTAANDWQDSAAFHVDYDKLVIAVGAHSQTFGIPGVREHAFFLKDVTDARRIRQRILHCFEVANLPTTSEEKKRQLLHFCVVGGGPTGVEFSAELHDLIHEDMARLYPSLVNSVRISVYDVAPRILNMFDNALSNYAAELFARQRIEVKTRRTVQSVQEETLTIKEEGEVPYGMLVWSTGLEMTPLVESLRDLRKETRSGKIITDNFLRPLRADSSAEADSRALISPSQHVMKDVYCLGDCATIESYDLPATAQVASQKAIWLRKHLNYLARHQDDLSHAEEPRRQFKFNNLGIMAYLGGYRAIMQKDSSVEIKGHAAWVVWRTAYLTMSVSLRNKILIPIYWTINWFFGRDITHF